MAHLLQGTVAAFQATDSTFDYGLVVDIDETTQICTLQMASRDETARIGLHRLIPLDEDCICGINDMSKLSVLNEATICMNLKNRYEQDHIYTNIGEILISVNPCKELDIFSDKVLDKYLTRDSTSRLESAHIYDLSDRAMTALTNNRTDQACIISGESGAGKTVATSHIISYVVARSNKSTKSEEHVHSLQDKILQLSPLLEAFGNAKTSRNNNSSRFGKLVEIFVDCRTEAIYGAKIVHYLLEKSRVVKCTKGERNYHIFYALVEATKHHDWLSAETGLEYAESYKLLGEEQHSTLYGNFDCIVDILRGIGLSHEDMNEVWKLLAAILHLGNIEFSDHNAEELEGCQIVDRAPLKKAAGLLGLDENDLASRVTQRKIQDASKSLSAAESRDTRDALAKALYASLFDWLVARTNLSLRKESDNKSAYERSFNVLDIFGFESFETNSFEQLCINYCNEKLHTFFLKQIIFAEVEVYKDEGIPIPEISFSNLHVVGTLEKRGGLFSLLDEQTKIVRGTETAFLNRIKHLSIAMSASEESESPLSFPSPKAIRQGKSETTFTIRHFAGPVEYEGQTFLTKNKDALSKDLIALSNVSKSRFVREMLLPFGDQLGRKTVIGQFRSQLKNLFQKLSSSEQCYVRAILPNSKKAANSFDQKKIIEQLRYSGLLELCKVRKMGYSHRQKHERFHNDFSCLANNEINSAPDLAKHLAWKQIIAKDSFAIGKSFVFLRNDAFSSLQKRRRDCLYVAAVTVQTVWRAHDAQVAYAKAKQSLNLFTQSLINGESLMAIKALEALPLSMRDGGVALMLRELAGCERPDMINSVIESQVVRQYQGCEIGALCTELMKRSDALEAFESALSAGEYDVLKRLLLSEEANILSGASVVLRVKSFVEKEERRREELELERQRKAAEEAALLRRREEEKRLEEERLKRIKEEEELKRLEKEREAKLEEKRRKLLADEEQAKKLEAEKRRRILEKENMRHEEDERQRKLEEAKSLAVADKLESSQGIDASLPDESTPQKLKSSSERGSRDPEPEPDQEGKQEEDDDEIVMIRGPQTDKTSKESWHESVELSESKTEDSIESEEVASISSEGDSKNPGGENTMGRILRPVKVLKAKRKLKRALKVNEIITLSSAIQYCKDNNITTDPSLAGMLQECKASIMAILRQHKEQLQQEARLKQKLAKEKVVVNRAPLVR